MNPISVGGSPESVGFWRAIILDALVVIFAGSFSYAFSRYLAGGSFWLVLTALSLWGAASFLEGILQKDAARRFGVIVLETVALGSFFYGYSLSALAIAAGIALLSLAWGYFSVRRELQNTVEVRFFTASGKAVGKVITAAVAFGVIMYTSVLAGEGNFFVAKSGFDFAYQWAAGVASSFYPTIPFTGSFGDFAAGVARVELQGSSMFQNLSQADKNTVVWQSASEIMAAFAPNASGTAAAAAASMNSEPAHDVFYRYLLTQAGILEGRFTNFFIGAWGLLFFLIVRGVGIIVVWLGQAVTLIFYELLLATGFMKIKEESSTKETITYT